MTAERFEQVKRAAHEMAAEIEWADFPRLPTADENVPCHGGPAMRQLLSALAIDPKFQEEVRRALDILFEQVARLAMELPGTQEVELEAAGMVQSAAKSVVVAMYRKRATPGNKFEPMAGSMRGWAMRTKFRRMAYPLIQAPPNVAVPSMAEQMNRLTGGRQ